MRTKKENTEPKIYPIRIFRGKYLSREFELINGESILVLEVKEGAQKVRIECPEGYQLSFPKGFNENTEYEFIIQEKVRNKVSFQVKKLVNYKKGMGVKELKEFYKSLNSITYEVEREGKPNVSWKEEKPSIPYERISVRTTYYELVVKDVSKIKSKLQ